MLADTGNALSCGRLVDRIRQAFTEAFTVAGHSLHIGVPVGEATAIPGDTADTLLHRCALAM